MVMERGATESPHCVWDAGLVGMFLLMEFSLLGRQRSYFTDAHSSCAL
jgi:hypothetical protein